MLALQQVLESQGAAGLRLLQAVVSEPLSARLVAPVLRRKRSARCSMPAIPLNSLIEESIFSFLISSSFRKDFASTF